MKSIKSMVAQFGFTAVGSSGSNPLPLPKKKIPFGKTRDKSSNPDSLYGGSGGGVGKQIKTALQELI